MSSGCPICGYDGSQVSPSDAAVALRSYPRRFAAALAGPDDDDRSDDAAHRRPADGGLSAVEHGAWAASGLAQIAQTFAAIVYRSDPVVALPELDPPPPSSVLSEPVATVVADIKSAGEELADAIQQAPPDGWNRSGQVGQSGGERVTALDVVRLAVHLGVHHLRLAERTMAEVVRQPG